MITTTNVTPFFAFTDVNYFSCSPLEKFFERAAREIIELAQES